VVGMDLLCKTVTFLSFHTIELTRTFKPPTEIIEVLEKYRLSLDVYFLEVHGIFCIGLSGLFLWIDSASKEWCYPASYGLNLNYT
jgi:hypothetical protein